jgi:hypothetical protein
MFCFDGLKSDGYPFRRRVGQGLCAASGNTDDPENADGSDTPIPW